MAENELELAHEEEDRIQELLSCLEAKLREYPDLLWGSSAGELRYIFEEVEGQEGYVCFVTFCPLLYWRERGVGEETATPLARMIELLKEIP